MASCVQNIGLAPVARPIASVSKLPISNVLLKPASSKVLCSRPFSSKQQRVRVPLLIVSAAQNDSGFTASATRAISRLGKKTIYLAGVSGPLTTRIAKKLLQNNIQVVTGVPEDDPANEALQFALKYELIKKDEAKRLKIRKVDDFGDPASFGIPSGATVVVVAGDQQAGLKVDDQVISAVATAASESRAARLVLVAPLGSSGGGGGGGFFGGLFGGGGGGGSSAALKAGSGDLKLSRTEQLIVDTELPFSIVRFSTDADSATEGTSGVMASSAGTLGRGAQPLSLGQASTFVSQVLLQGDEDTSFVIEAAASEEEAETPISSTVAEVLSEAAISGTEEEEEEEAEEEEVAQPPLRAQRTSRRGSQRAVEEQDEEEAPAAPKESAAGFDLKALFGGRGAQSAVADIEEEVEEAAEKVAKPARSFLRQRPKAKQLAEEVVDEVAEVTEKASSPLKAFFAGRPKQAKKEVEEDARELQSNAKSAASAVKRIAQRPASRVAQTAKEVDDAPASKKAGVFWSMLGNDKASAAEEETEDEVPPSKGLFGFGTQRLKQKAEKAEQAIAKGSKKAAKKVKRNAAAAADEAEDAAKAKKGGFLQSLGIGQQTKYADDE